MRGTSQPCRHDGGDRRPSTPCAAANLQRSRCPESGWRRSRHYENSPDCCSRRRHAFARGSRMFASRTGLSWSKRFGIVQGMPRIEARPTPASNSIGVLPIGAMVSFAPRLSAMRYCRLFAEQCWLKALKKRVKLELVSLPFRAAHADC
jgi:hypothetical protein